MKPRTVPLMMRMLFLLCPFWVSVPVVAFDEPHRPDNSSSQEAWEEKAGPWKLIGCTNGKPYVNLNFDPNDAISVATGHRDTDGTTYYILLVADDRLGTGQRHLHLVGRWPIPGGGRLTLDLLAKRGTGEDFQGAPQLIRSGGISLGYDAPRWFARLARDQRQNFGPSDAWRFSIGSRF